ncbi:antibiotic biosynthesis monooxygenase [Trinickia dabaoshanensis]|uniref:Antibiotic biosynthesis monooxygenase n=1 Tax=Trinickia dabaoshanensis TaxID=564714 RepID=A0A2N7VN06_9BURK|nr:putative quinol monooxygenase [Trinickia dabaoshanensis]PMS18553.1 antibiotic biosynthesis monooxygenase [Trinickia dabaoshanensis]
MSVSLVVLIEVQAGKSQQQIEAFRAIAPLVRAEAGCIEYELHRVQGNDEQFVITEQWASEDALAAHSVAPHMTEAAEKNKAFRAGPAKLLKLMPV